MEAMGKCFPMRQFVDEQRWQQPPLRDGRPALSQTPRGRRGRGGEASGRAEQAPLLILVLSKPKSIAHC